MKGFGQANIDYRKGKKETLARESAKIRMSNVTSDINERFYAKRNQERLEQYGNSGYFRKLGSDDRANGKVYNNIGANDSESKSYTAGYYINGEKRILAKLDKISQEERISLGIYEHNVLGITMEQLNLLKSNDDYMTGYMTAIVMESGHKKHR